MIIPTISRYRYEVVRDKYRMMLAAEKRRAAIQLCAIIACLAVIALIWILR